MRWATGHSFLLGDRHLVSDDLPLDSLHPGANCLRHVEATYIDESTADRLDNVTFAFVCVDKGSSRAGIFDLLIARGIPFIDVGMGLNRKHGPIGGMLRATYYPAGEGASMRDRQLADLSDAADDIYKSNIQIGELNALNACLAVVRYKQVRGLYRDTEGLRHILFGIDDMSVTGDKYDDDQA